MVNMTEVTSARLHQSTPPLQTGHCKTVKLLHHLSERNVQVWLEGGNLRARGPRRALGASDMENIQAERISIISSIKETIGDLQACSSITDRVVQSGYAPLASTQLAHWQLFKLWQRRSLRQLVSAMRLRGPLDVDVLKASIGEVVARHDALRTRIIVVEGVPVQEVCDNSAPPVRETSCIGRHGGGYIERQIHEFLAEPIDVSSDALFAVLLLKTLENEHVLLMAMEHMTSDAVSLNIAIRESLLLYSLRIKHTRVELPQVETQFPRFATEQAAVRSNWLRQNTVYWAGKLAAYGRLSFPEPCLPCAATQRGWVSIPLRIEAAQRLRLMQWCRRTKTTVVLGVLTAYFIAIGQWYQRADVVIQCMTDGRRKESLADGIGYFASPLYLRVEVRPSDTAADLNRKVTKEYAEAYDHADDAWMEARFPKPEFTCNPGFNWVVQGSNFDLHALDALPGRVECTPITVESPFLRSLERDNEPILVLYDAPKDITGGIFFREDANSQVHIENLANAFMTLLRMLGNEEDLSIRDMQRHLARAVS